MLFAICFNLDQSKILSTGNGLTLSQFLGFVGERIKLWCKLWVVGLSLMVEQIWNKPKTLVDIISTFSKMISRNVFLKLVKFLDCASKD